MVMGIGVRMRGGGTVGKVAGAVESFKAPQGLQLQAHP